MTQQSQAQTERLEVVIRHETGPAGDLTVLAHGEVTELTLRLVMAANILIIPIFVLLALVPLIVRCTLSGVARIADEADGIDVNQCGIRLMETEVPREIGPLVRAVPADPPAPDRRRSEPEPGPAGRRTARRARHHPRCAGRRSADTQGSARRMKWTLRSLVGNAGPACRHVGSSSARGAVNNPGGSPYCSSPLP